MSNYYGVKRDDEYLEHLFGMKKGGQKANHKYLMRVKVGAGYRYLYTPAEVAAYMGGQAKRAVGVAGRYAKHYAKQAGKAVGNVANRVKQSNAYGVVREGVNRGIQAASSVRTRGIQAASDVRTGVGTAVRRVKALGKSDTRKKVGEKIDYKVKDAVMKGMTGGLVGMKTATSLGASKVNTSYKGDKSRLKNNTGGARDKTKSAMKSRKTKNPGMSAKDSVSRWDRDYQGSYTDIRRKTGELSSGSRGRYYREQVRTSGNRTGAPSNLAPVSEKQRRNSRGKSRR